MGNLLGSMGVIFLRISFMDQIGHLGSPLVNHLTSQSHQVQGAFKFQSQDLKALCKVLLEQRFPPFILVGDSSAGLILNQSLHFTSGFHSNTFRNLTELSGI